MLKVGELKKLLENVNDDCVVTISEYDHNRDEIRTREVMSAGILDKDKVYEEADACTFMCGICHTVEDTGLCKEVLYMNDILKRDDASVVEMFTPGMPRKENE